MHQSAKTSSAVLAMTLVMAGSVTIGNAAGFDYEPLTLTARGNQFIAEGVIDHSTFDVVRAALSEHPDINELVLQYVPGSVDDFTMQKAAELIRNAGIRTVVPAGGLVASGGTDLFLAGIEREIGPAACVGVHSWRIVDGDDDSVVEGKDLPREHEEHRAYLTFYRNMGIDASFYWFTLEAADAFNMHILNNAEITRYGLVTKPVGQQAEASWEACAALAGEYGYS